MATCVNRRWSDEHQDRHGGQIESRSDGHGGGQAATVTGTALARLEDMSVIALALTVVVLAQPLVAQVALPQAKSDREAVQHGAQPNASEVRPGSRDGDAPSAAAGDLVVEPQRRILGLPITTALVVAGVLLVLLVVAGVVIPEANRRRRARGGGTYGRS